MATIRGAAIGLAMVLGCAGAARAQQAGGINFAELFGQLDANGDMVIEKGEVPESGRAAFETLLKNGDANKDGKIDREEYRAMLAGARDAMTKGAAPGVQPFVERFRAMDKDGDGKVTKDEFIGAPLLFERVDADHDGVITRAEVLRFQPAAGLINPDRFDVLDKDGDGKISRTEFTGAPGMFDRIDTDADGSISRAEAKAFAATAAANAPAGGALPIAARFRALDQDGDGKLTRSEWQGPPALFDRIDANRDGVLTVEELRAARPE